MINVYARDLGWLLEDFKAAFAAKGAVSSDTPHENASCWICVRTSDAVSSPNISKTIVQVHDMNDYDMALMNQAGLVLFTHPFQAYLWRKRGFVGRSNVVPIGSRLGIVPAKELPAVPTVGYFSGEAGLNAKRTDMFVEAVALARETLPFDVLMIGRWLDAFAHVGTWQDRAAGIADYQLVDVLVTCSPSPGVPLSVFEAASIGIPVVTTPRWFPVTTWPNIFVGEVVSEISVHIVRILQNREAAFRQRDANAYAPFKLDRWIESQLEHARSTWL